MRSSRAACTRYFSFGVSAFAAAVFVVVFDAGVNVDAASAGGMDGVTPPRPNRVLVSSDFPRFPDSLEIPRKAKCWRGKQNQVFRDWFSSQRVGGLSIISFQEFVVFVVFLVLLVFVWICLIFISHLVGDFRPYRWHHHNIWKQSSNPD